jgi:hypothetical protein
MAASTVASPRTLAIQDQSVPGVPADADKRQPGAAADKVLGGPAVVNLRNLSSLSPVTAGIRTSLRC